MAKEWKPKGVIKSKTLPIEIATNDYWEVSDDDSPAVVRGKKRYFTYDEAMAIESDGGWRLPTRAEWMGLCAELGEKNGDIDPSVLSNTLKLRMGGAVRSDELWHAGDDGFYWSSTTAPSARLAYTLCLDLDCVSTSYCYYRSYGLLVRLVRDVKE